MADPSYYYLAEIVNKLDDLNTNVLKLTEAIRSLSDDRSKTKKKVRAKSIQLKERGKHT